MKSCLVLGIGNPLLTDEGAGLRALEHFDAAHGGEDGVTCLDGGTLSFTLAGPIGASDALIVFDCARLGLGPGRVRCLEGAEMDGFVRSGKLSVHEVGLADLLDMARLTGDLPARRALVGIEPVSLGWGTDVSTQVAAALPEAVSLAAETLARWRAEQQPDGARGPNSR